MVESEQFRSEQLGQGALIPVSAAKAQRSARIDWLLADTEEIAQVETAVWEIVVQMVAATGPRIGGQSIGDTVVGSWDRDSFGGEADNWKGGIAAENSQVGVDTSAAVSRRFASGLRNADKRRQPQFVRPSSGLGNCHRPFPLPCFTFPNDCSHPCPGPVFSRRVASTSRDHGTIYKLVQSASAILRKPGC